MSTLPPNLPNLPMHLVLTLLSAFSWPIALASANAGLLPLKPPLGKKRARQSFARSLHREAKNRSSELLQGVARFSEIAFKRDLPEPPCIWHKGSARILDYGLERGTWNMEHGNVKYAAMPSRATPATIFLFIPSLINRYYILDLEKERSLLRFLSMQGVYPLVLDWGMPGALEQEFGVDDYVTDILLPAVDFIHQTSGMEVALGGYCMGGVLALAAAQLRPKKIHKLALFATPWNFHCEEFTPFILDAVWQRKLSAMIAAEKQLPAEIIQALFYLTDPFIFEEKFRRFLSMDAQSRAAKDFIALEHWVNDGVPMTSAVAQDCLIGWAQRNELAQGRWKVAGKIIHPQKIRQSVWMAIPKQDHVVPQSCALPLAHSLPQATLIHPSSGHVGMMVGSRAKSECWLPLVEWLHR